MRARRLVPRMLAPLALMAALVALPPAAAVRWLACQNEGSEACARQSLADVQLWIALAGLLPALLVAVDGVRGRRRALVWLALGALVYAVWAVTFDAAIHGWDDLRLLGGT